MTKKWLGDEAGALPPLLCGGLQNVESAQPNFGLWELSRLVLASDPLKKAFAAGDGAAIARALSGLEGSDVEKFREGLATFLAQHGYRAVMEGEAAAPTWAEDLPTVYAMIRNYLGVDESRAPKAVEAQARAAREKTTGEVMAGLKAWQRRVFKGVLKQAQRWLVTREHTKSLMMRLMDRRRRVCRELARRLVEQRRLDKAADLYLFTWEEVAALARGTLDAKDAARILTRRRAEEARNSALVLPDFFTGQPTPKPSTPHVSPAGGETLRGVPVCRGRVTGKARVILDPRIDAKIEPGEILVAPVTDAGWVPLFAAAAGLIVDVGGTLSHGATVAREYGLPAVVNAKGATRRIKTGDTVTLDGSTGVVTLG
jgi:pyruvate,water dikinase